MTTISANWNHPHNYTVDDPRNAVETIPDRNHPIFENEELKAAALYYDRKTGTFRRLFGEFHDATEMAYGNTTTRPIGVAPLRGYYFDNPESADRAWMLVRAAFVCVPAGPIIPGMRQVIKWARAYVDNETAIGDCHPDRLTPEERAGLEELERLEKML